MKINDYKDERYTCLRDEIDTKFHKDTSLIQVATAVAIMLAACATIYGAVSVLEIVMY